MLVYGQLVKAQLENRAADGSAGTTGAVWWNTVTGKSMLDDGTLIRALLRNDGNLIIGNNGTANNNIRLHRGASSVIQFVLGGDATAEGSLSTSLAQTSARLENYTNAARPAAGNAGRTIWNTDSSALQVDDGAAWNTIVSSSSSNYLVTFDTSASSQTVNAGSTMFYPYLTIDVGHTFTISGRLLTGPTLTVNGTLTVSGTVQLFEIP